MKAPHAQRKRAFFSFAVIALVTIAFFFFAGLAFSNKEYRDSATYSLEDRKVYQRAQDLNAYLSGAIDDAIVDAAYQAYNCQTAGVAKAADDAGFCTALTAQPKINYLTALGNLSSDGVTAISLSAYSFVCANAGVTTTGFNFTRIVTTVVDYKVSSLHASKTGTYKFVKRADINLTKPSNVASAPMLFNVSINDTSVRTPYSWWANCTRN